MLQATACLFLSIHILLVHVAARLGKDGGLTGHLTVTNGTSKRSANERLLLELSLPLVLRLDVDDEVQSLARELLFMDLKKGVSPLPSFWRQFGMLFDSTQGLHEKYGVRRLEAMQVLLTPSQAGETEIGPDSFPGQIDVFFPYFHGPFSIRVSEMVVQRRAHGALGIVINHTAVWRRLMLTGAVSRRLELRADLALLNEKIWFYHCRAILGDYVALRSRAKRRKRRQEFVRELRKFRVLLANRSGRERFLQPKISAGARHFDSPANTTVQCLRIRHALYTLRNQTVLPSDPRVRYLLLRESKTCDTAYKNSSTTMAPNVTSRIGYENAEEEMGVCDSRCAAYCGGVLALNEWSKTSGLENSAAQLHALYHSVLSSTTKSVAKDSEDYFAHLRQLVNDDIGRAVFSSCADLCRPTPSLRAEMGFFAGVIDLLDDVGVPNNTRKGSAANASEAWWLRARNAHLRIWSAARSGSKKAMRTLATMREHGMLARQHTRAATTLLRATLGKSSMNFWDQILRPDSVAGDKPETPSAYKLLKTERFFAVVNSWSMIDEPYVSRSRLSAFIAEIEGSELDDDNSATFTSAMNMNTHSVMRDLMNAKFLIAGIKGFPRDLRQAECLLLSVLRQLSYTCDVPRQSHDDDVSYFKRDGRGGSCQQHLDELRALRYSEATFGQCNLHNKDGQLSLKGRRRFLRWVRSRRMSEILQHALVLLSYIQLINGLKFSVSAQYAFLAMQLSAASFHQALDEIPPELVIKLQAGDRRSVRTWRNNVAPSDSPAAALLDHVVHRGQPSDNPKDFTRSGFVLSENLVLLAVAASRGGAEGERYLQTAVELFYNTSPCTEGLSNAKCASQHRFFLLREAARLWQDEADVKGVLDSRYSSPHRADAFLLMISQLRDGSISLEDVRDGILFTSSPYIPSVTHMLRPSPSDTERSYTLKLLGTAEKILHDTLTPVQSERKNGWHSRHDAAVPPHHMRVLRRLVRQDLHEHDIGPLLVVSDMHHYLDESKLTLFERLWRGLSDFIVAPFSYLPQERLEEQLVQEIMPLKQEGGEPFDFAAQLAWSSASSKFVREASIALQLLTSAMVSGEPEGFSFLFIEEQARANALLSSFTYFMSEQLWTHSSIIDVWMEEHKGAQWHHTKPKTKGRHNAFFNLNSRSPFWYASSEARMELFTHIVLRRALRRNQRINSAERCGTHSGSCSLNGAQLLAVHELAVCSGALIYAALKRGSKYPPLGPYDGMYLPVGSTRCLRTLLQGVQATGTSPFPGLSSAQAEMWLLDTLANITATQANFYEIDLLGYQSNGDIVSTELEMSGDEYFQRRVVEPWLRANGNGVAGLWSLALGEGIFYNSRLHDISGTHYAARLGVIYRKIASYVSRLCHLVRCSS